MRQNTPVTVFRHTDRISYARFATKTGPAYLINAHAPTLTKSEKDPQGRDDFYEQLDGLLQKLPRQALILLAGDFNAKTGTLHETTPKIVGRYGKGKANRNGQHL